MVIAVLADKKLKEAFSSRIFPADIRIIWADSLRSLLIIEADVYFDLLFAWDQERITSLQRLLPKLVIVNAVAYTIKVINAPFIRINGWPTMLERNIAEVSIPAGVAHKEADGLFKKLQWPYEEVSDVCGMVTPAIVAMIINEAFYTYDAGTSSKEEIDIAMKLGTNYPYGPFEWAEKIGLQYIVELLTELSRTDERYTIAPSLLKKENL